MSKELNAIVNGEVVMVGGKGKHVYNWDLVGHKDSEGVILHTYRHKTTGKTAIIAYDAQYNVIGAPSYS